jgi:hypothetical protein
MTSPNDGSDCNRARDLLAAQKSHAQSAHLAIARRIARETLQADHQALELDAMLAPTTHSDEWWPQGRG